MTRSAVLQIQIQTWSIQFMLKVKMSARSPPTVVPGHQPDKLKFNWGSNSTLGNPISMVSQWRILEGKGQMTREPRELRSNHKIQILRALPTWWTLFPDTFPSDQTKKGNTRSTLLNFHQKETVQADLLLTDNTIAASRSTLQLPMKNTDPAGAELVCHLLALAKVVWTRQTPLITKNFWYQSNSKIRSTTSWCTSQIHTDTCLRTSN